MFFRTPQGPLIVNSSGKGLLLAQKSPTWMWWNPLNVNPPTPINEVLRVCVLLSWVLIQKQPFSTTSIILSYKRRIEYIPETYTDTALTVIKRISFSKEYAINSDHSGIRFKQKSQSYCIKTFYTTPFLLDVFFKSITSILEKLKFTLQLPMINLNNIKNK